MKRILLVLLALALPAIAAVTLTNQEDRGWQGLRGSSNVGAPHATEAACWTAMRADAEARKASANYRCVLTKAARLVWTADPVTPPPVEPPPITPPPTGSLMPYVNTALIPAPNVGHSERRITRTGEMPGPSDIGAFRTACEFSHMNNDDPILFPGQQGRSHLHVFFGNTGANYASTPESIRTTGNSTCRGGIVNRSSYWVPAMIDTRDGRPVKPRESGFYYKTGYWGIKSADVRAFPPGFRMIAGDSKSDKEQIPVDYACNGVNWQRTIPVCQRGDVVEMAVLFPQCWNGVDLTAPDGRSHVSYPVDGKCPAAFPVALPEITVIAMFPVDNGSGADSSTWRLSSDNYAGPGGYSGHADWFHGWDQEVMNTFVNRVIQPSLDGQSHILGDGRVIY